MTTPLFLVDDIGGNVITLAGDEGRHAATVRRIQPGERVDVGDGRGNVAECVVTATTASSLTLDVTSRRTEPPPQPRIVVVQALAKAHEDAIQTMTEVGVDVFVPWAASRSVVRWEGDRAAKSLQRWRATAREAAKQARRAWVPEVTDLASTNDVAKLLSDASLAVVLHEAATTPLPHAPEQGDVLVVVGPEGGITDEELSTFGTTPYRLGRNVLRSATAGTAAAAVLLAGTNRWS